VSNGPFENVIYRKLNRCLRPFCGGQILYFDVITKRGSTFQENYCMLCSWPPGGEAAAKRRKEHLDALYPDMCRADEHPLNNENLYLTKGGKRGCRPCLKAKRGRKLSGDANV
jgi:hypothetical protein